MFEEPGRSFSATALVKGVCRILKEAQYVSSAARQKGFTGRVTQLCEYGR